MHWLADTFQKYPEIAIYLALGIGFWFGKLKFGSFSLGTVTSVLLAGVIIGALHGHLTISANVKSVFFLMFLFAVGYGVGPQFFHGLKSGGLKQALFACVVCVLVLLTAYVTAKVMRYDAGEAAGLLSGASTISAVLGVATDGINQLSAADEKKQAMLNAMPVAYAVTYLFGTAGSAWILASLGPRLLRVNLAEESRKMESAMGAGERTPGVLSAYVNVIVRAYRAENPKIGGKKVSDLEAVVGASRVFVERIRQPDDRLVDGDLETVIEPGAVLVISGKRADVLENGPRIGPEVDDAELLSFDVEILDVVVTNKQVAGKTIRELAEENFGQNARGVFLRKLVRAGQEMPIAPGLKIERGDVATLAGSRRNVGRVSGTLGYADRPTTQTDMMFAGFGIVVGAIIGAITVRVGGVPLTLSTSGGALIAGLVCGWLRSVHRTFGRIPEPALWVFNNVGLNTFIAVVGINAGPAFISGLKSRGLGLLISGVIVTTVPLVLSVFAAGYLFKFPAPIALGAVAGARTTTAALGALEQEAGGSKVAALGYTVSYAVGNILLTIWGVIIVMLMR